MVGQIGFYAAAAASSGWMGLCRAGWLGCVITFIESIVLLIVDMLQSQHAEYGGTYQLVERFLIYKTY